MKPHQKNAQTAIEYLVLLSLVAVIVIVGFSNLLPRANQSVSSLFFKARSSIMGAKVESIDGQWCDWSPCSAEGGSGFQKRLCDCPAPLGSGSVCSGPSQQPCAGTP